MSTELARSLAAPVTSFQKEVIHAMTHDMIRDIDDMETLKFIHKIHAEVAVIMQHTNTKSQEERKAFHHQILSMLKEEFKFLTPNEVLLAARKGARGIYTPNEVHFSVRTLQKWLTAYLDDRSSVVKDLNNQNKQIEAPKKMTLEDKKEAVEKFYLNWVDQKDKDLIFGYYDHFKLAWGTGLLRFDEDKSIEYALQAIQTLTSQYKTMQADRNLRHMANRQLKALDEIPEKPIIKDLTEDVKTESAKIALNDWFKSLYALELTPKTLNL